MDQNRRTNKDPELQERINLLYTKFKSFNISSNTNVTFETFFDVLSKINDSKKLDRGIMLRIFNDIPKNGKQTFDLNQFFSSYWKNLDHIFEQNELVQKRVNELEIQKKDVKLALQTLKQGDVKNICIDKHDSKLYITVFEARELVLQSGEQVYVRINCGNVTLNTRLISYSPSKGAVWEEKFVFPIKTGQEKINLVLISKSPTSATKILGNKQVLISSFKDQTLHEEWFGLAYDQSIICNKVKLGIQWINSKAEFLESTFDKIDHHLSIQEDEAKELALEIEKFNDLLPIQDITAFNFNTLPDIEISPKESPIHSLSILKPDHLAHFEEGLETLLDKVFFEDLKKKEISIKISEPYPDRRDTSSNQIRSPPQLGLENMTFSSKNDNRRSNFQLSPNLEKDPPLSLFSSFMQKENSTINPKGHNHQLYKNNQLNNQLKNTNSAGEENIIDNENFFLNQKLDALLKENNELKKHLDLIQTEKEKEKEEFILQIKNENEAKMYQLIGEVDRLGKLVLEKNKEIEKWKNQYYTMTNQESYLTRDLQLKIQELSDENTSIKTNLDKKNTEIIIWKEQIDKITEKNMKLKKDLAQNKQLLETEKNELSCKFKENSDLKLKIVQYEGIVKSLPTKVDEKNYLEISEILQKSINIDSNFSKYSFQKNYFSPFVNKQTIQN